MGGMKQNSKTKHNSRRYRVDKMEKLIEIIKKLQKEYDWENTLHDEVVPSLNEHTKECKDCGSNHIGTTIPNLDDVEWTFKHILKELEETEP